MEISAYLDNNLIGPNLEQEPGEKKALEDLVEYLSAQNIGFTQLTSNRTANEYEKWKDKAKQEAMRKDHATKGRVTRDHTVKGFVGMWDRYGGGGTFPIVADVPNEDDYKVLRSLGLQDMDAKHIAIAIHHQCDYFLTRDRRSILNHRDRVQAQFPAIKLMRPAELLADLKAKE